MSNGMENEYVNYFLTDKFWQFLGCHIYMINENFQKNISIKFKLKWFGEAFVKSEEIKFI